MKQRVYRLISEHFLTQLETTLDHITEIKEDLETSIEDLKHSAQLCLPQEDAPPVELFPKSPLSDPRKDRENSTSKQIEKLQLELS